MDEFYPKCPICGAEAEQFVVEKTKIGLGNIVGCECCTRTVYWFTVAEHLKSEENAYLKEDRV